MLCPSTLERPIGRTIPDAGPAKARRPARAARSKPAERGAGARPDLAGVRVLVVEDEALIALDVTCMLEALGAEVCGTAASSADAVRQARGLRPQLAVVDIHLRDGETGIGVARVMAEELSVAIVFATAYSDPDLQARMADVAGAARVFKPYGAAELLDAARQALRRF